MQTRHITSAIIGGVLLVCTLAELLWGSFNFYLNFYAVPKEKYGVLDPLRWQDIVFLIAFYLVMGGLSYISYRLLKYSFQRKPVPVTKPSGRS